jgi:hypothetical protein
MNSSAILRPVLVAPLLLFCVVAARGQTEAASPDNTGAQAVRAQQGTLQQPATTPTIGPLPTASPAVVPIEPASIIPPNMLPGPDTGALPQLPASPELQQLNELFKRSSLGRAADEHRLHVQTSALQAQIRNDQDLHDLRRSAEEARTDLERRHRFRKYFEVYYQKLRARADSPELIDYLKAQEAAHELTLLQPRTRHETDEAEAAKLAIARAGASAAPVSTPAQAKVNDVFNH